ncbi:MAG TPA: hypothetical protein VI704_03760 [Bacteroidota bacterium]|nr:hypothetical protein [Bacteroidota bacterium]
MGQQQLLLIILGVIIVGIAIAVGLSLFSAQSVQSNKDAMINDLNNIAAQCYQFRIRPSSMGGGQGSYSGFTLPTKMATNENGVYVPVAAADEVVITATSAANTTNLITVTVNSDGKLIGWSYDGDFQ